MLEERKPGEVSILHARCVHADRTGTNRSDGTLRQCPFCLHKRRFQTTGGQSQITLTCRYRPEGIVRIMVPLPHKRQVGLACLAHELVGADNSRNQSLACRKLQLVGSHAIHPQYRPAVFPLHRYQIGNAPHCTAILKQIGKPPSVRRIHQSALGNTTVLKDNASLVRSRYLIGTVHHHCTHTVPWPSDVEQIIPAIYLEQLRAFCPQHNITACRSTGILQQHPFRTGFQAGQICLQFRNKQLAIAINQIIPAIFIKEESMVMTRRCELHTLPRSFLNIACHEKISLTGGLCKSGNIIHPFVIADTACPRATSVGILPVIQIHGRNIVGQPIIRIAHQFPVHQIL